jgi:hypothetical protein
LNVDEAYRALTGFKNCQTFVSAAIISQRDVHYQWKRYSKVPELMQKASVGTSVGSRIGRIVGYPTFTAAADPHFSQRLLLADNTGITRDEIGVHQATGLFSKLNGRAFDLDEADSFVKNIKKRLDIIRRPTMTKKMLMGTMWSIPTTDLLLRFATMPRNVVVLGDKRITFGYASHEIKTYVTGDTTGNFRWTNLLEFLEDSLKKHMTIGAYANVYHHRSGFLGQVKKVKSSNDVFVPIGVAGLIPGVKLPENWEVAPRQEQLEMINIKGLEELKFKMLEVFGTPKKKSDQVERP